MEEDPKEKAAILIFLKTFNTVCNLEGFKKDDYDPDVEYALSINHAGRNIVEGNGDRPLPLSVWPIVLERSFEKSGYVKIYYDDYGTIKEEQKHPTGLYYLLRNGPALVGRVGLVSNGTSRLLSSNEIDDDGNDDDDDDDDDAKENPSKRCKLEESKGDSAC